MVYRIVSVNDGGMTIIHVQEKTLIGNLVVFVPSSPSRYRHPVGMRNVNVQTKGMQARSQVYNLCFADHLNGGEMSPPSP